MLEEKNIKEILTGISKGFDKELFDKKQEELESYWHFNFDKVENTTQCYYKFTTQLEQYKYFCRRWEEKHNGIICVVERVRDTYLWPKIEKFIKQLK